MAKRDYCKGQAAIELPAATARHLPVRGQAAIEVLSYAAFFMLVFVVGAAIFLQLEEQELSRAENAFAQQVAYQFADYIETAFIAGPGFSGNVTVPASIHGRPYTISVSRPSGIGGAGSQETGFVYIDWRGPVRASSFSAPSVTADYQFAETFGFIYNNSRGAVVINASKGLPITIENVGGAIRFRG